MTRITNIIKTNLLRVAVAASSMAAAANALAGPHAQIIKRSMGIGNAQSGDLKGIVAAASSLTDPMTVAVAAITPLALIIGIGMTMTGHRKGVAVIGTSVGCLIGLGIVTGLVA